MAKLIVLCGIPGAGKSSYAEYLCRYEHQIHPEIPVVIHASDAVREELFGDASVQDKLDVIFKILHSRVRADLNAGKTVIYDATNTTRKTRRKVLSLMSSRDTAECHIVWTPIHICRDRDQARNRTVGPEVIDKMVRRWQAPWEDEGFSRILVINNYSDFNQEQYKSQVIKDMAIPHDNPHHSVGILKHCELAYEYLVNNLLADESDTELDIESLKLATYYHDIGKPYTKFYKKSASGDLDLSCAHYYDHHNVGGYLAYGLFVAPGEVDDTIIRNACFIAWLISTHMDPFFNTSYYRLLNPVLRRHIDLLHEADVQAH